MVQSVLLVVAVSGLGGSALAQDSGEALDPFILRIDHRAVDRARQRLIVAAHGNDTVQVVELPQARYRNGYVA